MLSDAMKHGAAVLGECGVMMHVLDACLAGTRSAVPSLSACTSLLSSPTGVQTKATIKQAKPDQFVEKTLDRSLLWEMHTPQARLRVDARFATVVLPRNGTRRSDPLLAPQVIRPQVLRDGFKLVAEKGLAVRPRPARRQQSERSRCAVCHIALSPARFPARFLCMFR